MVRKFIEQSNRSLSSWAAEKKLRQVSEEKRVMRRSNAPPSALDELTYPPDITEVTMPSFCQKYFDFSPINPLSTDSN